MSRYKHIFILLLVSFSILIGHNLIPHQHHSHNSARPITQTCPEGHHDHQKDHTGTKHCHAFNDIDFVKYSSSGIPIPASAQTAFVMVDPAGFSDPLAEAELSQSFCLKLPIHSALCSGPPSLRAPPLVA